MHELGLCEAIVDVVEKRTGERPVAGVRARVGPLHHAHPEAFEQSFAPAAAGCVSDSLRAELVLMPVRGRCLTCWETFESSKPIIACPACGARGCHRSAATSSRSS